MIRLEISSNAQEIIRKVGGFPPVMAAAVAQSMDEQNQITIGYISANKLSKRGPTTLGVRTNLLRKSLHNSAATIEGNSIESSIGTNVEYAGVHEYGFDGVVQVRGFTRHNPRGDRTSGTGGVVSLASGRIRKVKIKQTASGISVVKPFSRHMRIPERSFIRSSIAERAGNYSVAISNAILAAWEIGGTS